MEIKKGVRIQYGLLFENDLMLNGHWWLGGHSLVEHLPGMSDGLGSIPSNEKKKKNQMVMGSGFVDLTIDLQIIIINPQL